MDAEGLLTVTLARRDDGHFVPPTTFLLHRPAFLAEVGDQPWVLLVGVSDGIRRSAIAKLLPSPGIPYPAHRKGPGDQPRTFSMWGE